MEKLPRINKTRLLAQLDALAKIGSIDGGGVCRLAFSEVDKEGRDFVEARMKRLGLDIYIDPIGNLLGIRRGRRDAPLVLTGSHTDSVGTGGRFDGSLGVLAALEAIETLNEADLETDAPIGIVSFVNEEGVRFMPDMMGSLFFRGDLSIEDARSIVGIDGTTIGENLDRTGYAGTDDLRSFEMGSFVELHIEQGPVLEKEKRSIGIVDRVQGISWFEVDLTGTANHAGATPMTMRHDAGYAAAALSVGVRKLTRSAGEELRATVGSATLHPNLINVIAQQARVTVDLRHPEAAGLVRAEENVKALLEEITQAEGIQYSMRSLARLDPVSFDEGCVQAVTEAAAALGYTSKRMSSGAGHDAMVLAAIMPASMIFVPSRGGISHNINEYTAPDHIEAGANVLLHTLIKQAGVVD